MTKDIVILYHAGCSDGFTAAWAAWKKFGDKAEYIPAHYQDHTIKDISGHEVYILDFAIQLPILEELIKNNKKVTSIDHHATGSEAAKLTQNYLFDINNSGAVLAWKYFHPDIKVPKLCEYIEDRDLFLFKLEETKELCAYADLIDFSFDNWSNLVQDVEDPVKFKSMIEKGSSALKYERKIMSEIVDDTARLVEFEGYKIYAVNAPHWYASGVCEILYKKYPPMAISWSYDKDALVVSLRSDLSVNVGQLAKKYGGGGHKGAAGFELKSLSDIPWKEIESNK